MLDVDRKSNNDAVDEDISGFRVVRQALLEQKGQVSEVTRPPQEQIGVPLTFLKWSAF